MEKFTSGLYWSVHDYEKYERKDEDSRDRWSEVHGIIEKMPKTA